MFKYVKKYVGFLILAGISMVVEVMVDLFQPSIMSRIVDDGVLGVHNGGVGDMSLVLRFGLIMVGLIIAGFIGGSACSLFANIGSENATNLMRKDCFSRVMSFSFPQIDKFGSGALITRITNDITQVRNMIEMSVRGVIRTSFFFCGSIFFLFTLYPRFGFIALCSLPVIMGFILICLKKVSPGFSKMQEELDVVNSILQEDITGIRIIKACVKEIYERARFKKANDRLTNTQLKVLIVFAFMNPTVNMMMYIVTILIILIGGTTGSGAAPGSIIGAISYATQLVNSITSMIMMFQNISRGRASWKRVKQVLNTEPEIKDGEFEGDTEVKGKIEFRNVSFTYPGTSLPVLDNVNLVINPGETFAIMGATGCGKSTLVNLIPRFYDTGNGQVLVDDVDVRDYKQMALRSKISIALQKSELFSLTAAENISWGNLEASEEEIRNAAITAQADSFISAMPEGYESVIAERGMSLSGGQRQRVSIARAMLKNAEILIFDDSTSALDLKTEAMFYDALDKANPGSTRIIVAQRIATVMRADRIAILEDGCIAACGSHDELLATNSIYQAIYNSQIGKEASNG